MVIRATGLAIAASAIALAVPWMPEGAGEIIKAAIGLRFNEVRSVFYRLLMPQRFPDEPSSRRIVPEGAILLGAVHGQRCSHTDAAYPAA